MLGRPRESARLAAEAVDVIRRYGIEHGPLLANHVEALVAVGEWEDADRVSAAALRANTANWPHNALISRAELEIGRGDFDAARAHLEAALATVREDERGSLCLRPRRRRARPLGRPLDGRRRGRARGPGAGALPRRRAVSRPALRAGLRAQAELATLARVRGDADAAPRPPRAGARRCSPPRAEPPPRPRPSRRTRPAGARWPRPSTRAPAGAARRTRGPRPRPRGSGSSGRRSRPTAAGDRPRRSPPPAPTRPSRCERPTRWRRGSGRDRCCGSWSCSPSARSSSSFTADRRRGRSRPPVPRGRCSQPPAAPRGR